MTRKPAGDRTTRPVQDLDGPDISAIICARTGGPRLERALDSLLRQELPDGLHEILLVDGSPEGVAETVRDLAGRVSGAGPDGLGRVRYLRDEGPGTARRMNLGWQSARSPIVAFLGEQAMAHPSWLGEMFGAFADLRAKPGIVGGRVEGEWLAERPDWLPDALLPWLPVLDLGDAPTSVPSPASLSGTNMAIRRDLLIRIGGFTDPPVGGRTEPEELLMEAARRIARLNAAIYCPRALTRHSIDAERLTRPWLLDQAGRRGWAEAVADLDGRDLPPAQREMMARRRMRALRTLRCRLRVLMGNDASPDTMLARCELARARGYALTLRGQGAPPRE